MITTASNLTLITALNNVNKEQGYNLEFNRFDKISRNRMAFTIKSKKSGIPGSRYSGTGRKLISASWHAHGYLFDEIFKIEPEAFILSYGKKMTNEAGNWQDRNIGSIMQPCYFSETSIL